MTSQSLSSLCKKLRAAMCSPSVHFICTICSLYVHYIPFRLWQMGQDLGCIFLLHSYSTCVLLHFEHKNEVTIIIKPLYGATSRYVFTICSPYIHHMFTICSLYTFRLWQMGLDLGCIFCCIRSLPVSYYILNMKMMSQSLSSFTELLACYSSLYTKVWQWLWLWSKYNRK